MRIHRLELVGIGPFRHRQVLDFDRLNAAGLFLVDGPTGAGKSSLIDAIVFALYGGVAGSQSDTGRIRSHHSQPDEPSEVILEFSVQGRRHRIARKPAYDRPKKKGTGTTPERAAARLEVLDANGDAELADSTFDDIGAYVRRLLGMSAEQFRQLVVLPQGEFDALLHMRPLERQKALGNLLGTEFFKRVTAALGAQADAVREGLATTLASVAGVVSRVEGVLLGMPGDLGESADLSVLREVLADAAGGAGERESAMAGILRIAQSRHQESARLAQHWAESTGQLSDKAAQARRVWEGFDRLETALGGLAKARALLLQADGFVAELPAADISARAGDLREQLGAFAGHVQWESQARERAVQRQSLAASLDDAGREAVEASARKESLPARQAELRAQASSAREAEGNVATWEKEAERLAARALVLHQLAEATDQAGRADAAHVAALDHARAAQSALLDARARLDFLRGEQVAQAAARLAEALEDGQACPVCGAAEHPAPAHAAAGSSLVSAEAVDAAFAAVEEAEARQATAHEVLSHAADDASSARTARDLLAGSAGTDDPAVLARLATEAELALEQARGAADAVAILAGQLADLEDEAVRIDSDLLAAAGARERAETALRAFDEGVEQGAAAVARALASLAEAFCSAGTVPMTASDAVEQLRERVLALDTLGAARAELDLATAALGGATIDAEEARAAHERAESELSEAIAMRDQALAAASGLEAGVAALGTLHADLLTALARLAEQQARGAAAIRMADVASGRGADNIKRTALESFVVQQRFASVLAAASVHLDRMSSGKYSLDLEEDAKGNQQAGLGISVIDAWTGRRRDPRTLSGGETFYVSLSLALGLADVVQYESGGVPIDTLFVDEGFGSLDQDTLNLVLEQLDHLRSGGRVIGLVSHVTEMKEWVPDRIEVSVGSDRTSDARVLPEA